MKDAGRRDLYVLVGPTATGKSAVAQHIAETDDGVVLSADSMLIYRGMDIGTAKPSQADRRCVAYLGLDLVDPCVPFSVWAYREAVMSQLAKLDPLRQVVMAGGSGLYVKALTMGLDRAGVGGHARDQWNAIFEEKGVAGLQEALRERDAAAFAALSDSLNPRRLIRALERLETKGGGAATEGASWDEQRSVPVFAGLWMDPDLLNKRIEQRVAAMYADGLLDEVAVLLADPRGLSPTASQAIGYAEAIAVLDGRLDRSDAMALTAARTRRLAKRQRTWFRHQAQVEWIVVTEDDSVESLSRQVKAVWQKHGAASIA